MWHALKEKEQKKVCEGRKSLLGIGVGISKEIFVLCLKILGFFGGGAAGFVFLIIHKRLSNKE